MALYRFVGAFAVCETLPVKTLAAFGQQIDVTEDLANECILHKRIDLVPEAIWEERGITPEEAKKYSDSKQHANASEEFRAKKFELLKAVQDYRAALATALQPASIA